MCASPPYAVWDDGESENKQIPRLRLWRILGMTASGLFEREEGECAADRQHIRPLLSFNFAASSS